MRGPRRHRLTSTNDYAPWAREAPPIRPTNRISSSAVHTLPSFQHYPVPETSFSSAKPPRLAAFSWDLLRQNFDPRTALNYRLIPEVGPESCL